MKKSILLIILTALTLGLFKPVPAQAAEQKLPSGTSTSQIGQKIQDFVKEHEKTTTGMETAVFDTNGTIYRGNFGYMDKENKVKADDDSVFEWGSVTKLTIWVSVMQLWEEGKIDLEEDIRTYLPEGFLKKLRYDKPITMTDLMNHQAGFDETPLYKGDKNDLEELLLDYQPSQSFEPGTTTAYSNFGTGLAGYIVERISGQNYADYVHEHIFQPLDMDRTALLPDMSDNDYVAEKRKEDKGYTSEGELIGDAPFKLGLYPSGGAAGTLTDLQKFAQALLGRKTLFKHPETWTTLYTATATYPGTDITRNAHGFWANEYGVMLLGHRGDTIGFTSRLQLDLKNGIGQVIMTNQRDEHTYNEQMPELIFGQRRTAGSQTKEDFEPGYYRILRAYSQGPASWSQLLTMFYLKKPITEIMGYPFWTVYKNDGQIRLALADGDLGKVSEWEVWTKYGLVALAGLSILYALSSLLIRLLLGLYRMVFGQKKDSQDRSLKLWHVLTATGIAAVAGNFLLILQNATLSTDYNIVSQWRYMVFAGLGLFLIGCTVYPILTKSKSKLSRSGKVLTVLTSLSALAIVANILYWSLYQWWVM